MGSSGIERDVVDVHWRSTICSVAPVRGLTARLPQLGLEVEQAGRRSSGNFPRLWSRSKSRPEGIRLRSVQPEWDSSTSQYTLDFGGRVSVSSSKNFILQLDDLHTSNVLLCGKCGEDTFACDFADPVSAVQAFAIALSSFDFKLCNAV